MYIYYHQDEGGLALCQTLGSWVHTRQIKGVLSFATIQAEDLVLLCSS